MFEKIYDVKCSKALSCSELAVLKYLISLINMYGNDIISPVHEETSIKQIKYINYAYLFAYAILHIESRIR